MHQIVNSIQKLLEEKLNIYTPILTPHTNLKIDLDLAEWELLYLFNAVEQTWHISIPQNDSDKIVSIEHLLAVVKKQKKSGLSNS